MKWTEKQPDRAGWWWAKYKKTSEHTPVRVQFYKEDNVWGWTDGLGIDCGGLDDFDLWSDEPAQEPEE